MEANDHNDLDDLIADSLGGVQSALDGERKAAPASTESAARSSAGEAVRELQQGPGRSDDGEGQAPSEEFFCNLVKSFQDDEFQNAMSKVLQGVDDGGSAGMELSGDAAKASGSGDAGVEDFLQNFLKSFDGAVGQDGNFEKSLSTLMTSMLSNDLICEPLQQIADNLEPWLKNQKGLSAADKTRYDAQLQMYKRILAVYKGSPDPLPENAREEVQRLLSELHALGQPPDEVMKQITPKDAEGTDESFEDFMKTMGLDSNLGSAEQDLLKKLAEDPEELTKVMKDMAQGLPDEGCKQQ